MKEKTLHLTRAALIAALYVILTFSHITILYTLTGNPSIQFKIFPAKKDVYHTISDTIHISK